LRGNLPFNNRVVLADEDKAVIVGSNYKFPPDSLDALRLRFNVEDYRGGSGEINFRRNIWLKTKFRKRWKSSSRKNTTNPRHDGTARAKHRP
jgi:hypothetical protein